MINFRFPVFRNGVNRIGIYGFQSDNKQKFRDLFEVVNA